MATLVTREAKSWIKCSCCSAQVRTCEKFLQVVNDNGKDRRGERYCLHCENYAHMNNEDIGTEADVDDGEHHLRQMENFAAYRAAGCSHEYFNDQAAGFVE